jgi:membrane associated rhomboid family serine protease
MDGQQPISFVLPRPGRALKLLLVAIFGLGVFNAAARWIPHGEQVFLWLACDVDKVHSGQIWRLVTSGLLTSPDHYGHLLFTIMGLYFLTPDLERRWGSWRMLRFLVYAVLLGNLGVLLVSWLVPAAADPRFSPPFVYGASSAIAATAVAWSRDNADATVRMMFVLPMRGRWLLWITLGICVLDLIYPNAPPEGVVAPLADAHAVSANKARALAAPLAVPHRRRRAVASRPAAPSRGRPAVACRAGRPRRRTP